MRCPPRVILLLLAVTLSCSTFLTVLRFGDTRRTVSLKQEIRTDTLQHRVILLTYMRSGSSLTGDILQQHPDVFYVFEPLWMTEKIFNREIKSSKYRLLDNSYLRVPESPEDQTARYTQVLDAFLHCRLREIDVSTLTQYFMSYSKSTKEFKKCAQDDTDLARVNHCIEPLIIACQKSRVVALKVIRSTMYGISSIFTSDSNVKVIHLIRDPRAVLKSQHRVGSFKWRDVAKASSEFCQRVENDISVSTNLSKIHTNRILTVRYEDIVDYPLETGRKMYAFFNLDMTLPIQKYIWNITYGGHKDGCFICIVRSNATSTANTWRRKLPFHLVNEMQQGCGKVLRIMGYRTFNNSQEVKDLQLSAQYISFSRDSLKVRQSSKWE